MVKSAIKSMLLINNQLNIKWRVEEDFMVIKYINTKEDYCEILEYINGKRLKLFNVIAGLLSIVIGCCIYILFYKLDNIYRIIISVLISILACVITIKRNRNSFYRIVDKLVTSEMLELTINKN